MDLLAYADGVHNIFEIARKTNKKLKDIIKEAAILENNGLLKLMDNS
jgi:aminopeptidase-like protein